MDVWVVSERSHLRGLVAAVTGVLHANAQTPSKSLKLHPAYARTMSGFAGMTVPDSQVVRTAHSLIAHLLDRPIS